MLPPPPQLLCSVQSAEFEPSHPMIDSRRQSAAEHSVFQPGSFVFILPTFNLPDFGATMGADGNLITYSTNR
jgi:hypothetical protein